MTRVSFRPAALRDIDGIWDYTAERWGEDRAVAYVLQLKAASRRIALREVSGRMVSGTDGLLRYRVASHAIFYRNVTAGVEIIRILHSRQDPALNLDE